MFGPIMRRFNPEYGRKAEPVTPGKMLRGMAPRLFVAVGIVTVTILLSETSRNILVPIVILLPGAFSWLAWLVYSIANIQHKVSLKMGEDLWYANDTSLIGNEIDSHYSYLDSAPRELPCEIIGEKRFLKFPWNDHLAKLGVDIEKLDEDMQVVEIEEDGENKKYVYIPAETYNYELRFRYFWQVPDLKINADKVLLMSKDRWDNLPRTRPFPAVMDWWYGWTKARKTYTALQWIDFPKTVDGVAQMPILRDVRTLSTAQIASHQERVSLANKETRQVLVAITAFDREKRMQAEYQVVQESLHSDASMGVLDENMRGQFGIHNNLATTVDNIMKPKRKHFAWKKLFALLFIAVIVYLILRYVLRVI